MRYGGCVRAGLGLAEYLFSDFSPLHIAATTLPSEKRQVMVLITK